MSYVFELVSLESGLAQREDPVRDLVAKAIIECAQKGHFSREKCTVALTKRCRQHRPPHG